MKILITGAAGYIGSMLVNKILKEEKDSFIIGIDLLSKKREWENERNLFWIKGDLALNNWQEEVLKLGVPDIIVHSAFRIRNPFLRVKAYERNNLAASKNVFEFAFQNNVSKLIYLSSVAAYGAFKENIGKLLKESDPLLETKNPYGYQKKLVEEELLSLYKKYKPKTKTIVLRLNSVTGPYGQSLSSKFGLITFLKKILPFIIELNEKWARQFVHEEDVLSIIDLILKKEIQSEFIIFNVAPQEFLEVRRIARILNKKIIRVPVFLVKFLLFLLWPISFGKLIPPQGINGLVYPINVDNSKLKKELGFEYKYTPEEALLGKTK